MRMREVGERSGTEEKCDDVDGVGGVKFGNGTQLKEVMVVSDGGDGVDGEEGGDVG